MHQQRPDGFGASCQCPMVGYEDTGGTSPRQSSTSGGLLLFLGGINGAQTGALSGFEAFKAIARINLISGALTFPLMVAGAWHWGVAGAVWGLIEASLRTVSSALPPYAQRLQSSKSSMPSPGGGASEYYPRIQFAGSPDRSAELHSGLGRGRPSRKPTWWLRGNGNLQRRVAGDTNPSCHPRNASRTDYPHSERVIRQVRSPLVPDDASSVPSDLHSRHRTRVAIAGFGS